MKLRTFLAAFVITGGSLAIAATSPLPGTLQGLIDLGAGGMTAGDKTFYDFTYQGQPAAAGDIRVVQAPGSDVGIEFQYNWTSTSAKNEDAVIRYKVHVNDPARMITGVSLHFDGSAFAAGSTTAPNTDLGTNATVTETIDDLSGNMLTSNSQLGLFNAGANFASINKNDALFVLPPPAGDLMLEKDITVHSTIGGGTATISLVDNTFRQNTPPAVVPLPTGFWTALGTIGLGLVRPLRRRLRHLILS